MSSHPLIAGLAIYGCYEALRKVGLVKDIDCPPAIADKALNRQNKRKAVELAHYGPAAFGRALSTIIEHVRGLPVLVPLGHDEFWEGAARRRDVPVEEARIQLCGNCAHFDITPSIVACGGASERPILVPCAKGGPPRLTTPQGFCQAHHFTCSALRTCDTWKGGGPKGGGPITEYSGG